MNNRLDSYGKYPSGMQEYLNLYGWHFSKKMCMWAISLLEKSNIAVNKSDTSDICTKELIEDMFKKHNIILKNNIAYDVCYILNYTKITLFKISLDDEIHLAKYVKCYFDNINSYREKAFTRFYADCIAKGIPIIWEDMI